MDVNIQSVHFKADQKLESFISEKISKLSGMFEGVIASEVTLRLDKSDTQENKITEIRLVIPGNDLFARKQCRTFEEATDVAVEALRRQLKRHKEKIRGR
jgi:putative sigma-54 modulation protein